MDLDHISLNMGGARCETRVHYHAAGPSRLFIGELKLKLIQGSAIVKKYQVLFYILHEDLSPKIRRSKSSNTTFLKVRIVNNFQLDLQLRGNI